MRSSSSSFAFLTHGVCADNVPLYRAKMNRKTCDMEFCSIVFCNSVYSILPIIMLQLLHIYTKHTIIKVFWPSFQPDMLPNSLLGVMMRGVVVLLLASAMNLKCYEMLIISTNLTWIRGIKERRLQLRSEKVSGSNLQILNASLSHWRWRTALHAEQEREGFDPRT